VILSRSTLSLVVASVVAVFCGAALLAGDAFAQAKKVEINEEWMEENVQTPYKELLKGNRSSEAQFKANADTYVKNAEKMIAALKTVSENPWDKNGKGQKTDTKIWVENALSVQKTVQEMAAAAKAQKAADYKAAFLKMENGCTKCHDVYKP
jgi:cytochrome c556